MRRHRGSVGTATRRGTVILIALVLLVLLAALLNSATRSGLMGRARIDLEERIVQAEWLAESGLDRAAARLAADPDYTGEDWEIPAADLGGAEAALVRITVKPVADAPASRRVVARAEYPRDPGRRAVRSRSARVDITDTPHPEAERAAETRGGASPEEDR